jgi:hypothetical protein
MSRKHAPNPDRISRATDEGNRDTLRFYETVARNRGYQTEIFTDPGQAIEWLLR